MCHLVNMYIRRTQIQKKKEGGFYYTYRIVESLRTGKQVRQITLLNCNQRSKNQQKQRIKTRRNEQRSNNPIHGQYEKNAMRCCICLNLNLLQTLVTRYEHLCSVQPTLAWKFCKCRCYKKIKRMRCGFSYKLPLVLC